MKILAIDQGIDCGWALWDGAAFESGVQEFALRRGESAGMRYLRLRRWLTELYGLVKFDLIVYEQQHNRGGAATEIATGFVTHLQAFCAEHGLEHASVHSATLKKFATGSGRADKQAMLNAVRSKWKTSVESDDEADAIALLHHALAEIV